MPSAPRASAATAREPTGAKRLCFHAVLVALNLGFLVALEVGYRLRHSIPLFGGKVRYSDLLDEGVAAGQGFEEGLVDYAHPHFKPGHILGLFRKSTNPVLFYELRPGAERDIYAVNSAGFRDRELPEAKPPGTFRIALLGDSIAWGHGLPLEQSLAKVLERLLNASGAELRFEVLNFGVSGYSTQQEVELYRVKAARYEPDLVIVAYCLNDAAESSIEGAVFKRLYFDLLHHSYLWDEVVLRAQHIAAEWFGYEPNFYQTQVDVRRQLELLQRHSAGVERMVVIFPLLQWSDEGYLHAPVHEAVAQAVAGLEYELLDLAPVFRRLPAEELRQVPIDTTHPNALGTRMAAEAVLQRLVERGMVPAPRGSAGAER